MCQRSTSNLFIPPALAPLKIKPEDCQLVVSYNKSSSRTRFTFSVSWSVNNQDQFQDDDMLVLSIRAPVDESSNTMPKPRSSQRTPTKEMIRCDGPCGRLYSSESMNILGRCGHFLCDTCYGLVYNDDGTKGCSNFQCVFATLYDYLPEDCARKAYENHIKKRQRAREMKRARERERAQLSPSPASTDSWQNRASNRGQGGQSCSRSMSDPVRSKDREYSCDSPSRSLNIHSALKMKDACNAEKAGFSQRKSDAKIQKTGRQPCSSSSMNASSRRERMLKDLFSDMTISSGCFDGPSSEFELLNIRLMIFEPGPFKTIKRVHISHEMSAALTLKEAIDELMDKRVENTHHQCPSRLFFCSDNTSGGLRRITIEEFETARLWQYPARNGALHFVLDSVGYLKAVD